MELETLQTIGSNLTHDVGIKDESYPEVRHIESHQSWQPSEKGTVLSGLESLRVWTAWTGQIRN